MSKRPLRRILIATDGSDTADAALDFAASLALISDQPQLRVVQVSRLEVHHRHGIWDVELRRNAEDLLEHAVARLRGLGVKADSELERSDRLHVGPALVEAARRFQADLVVVGSRGLSDWAGTIQHSVSHNLMTSLGCPLLMVRPRPASAAGEPSRILVAVGAHDDGSATGAAAAAAHLGRSRVLVVHVLPPGAEDGGDTVDRAIRVLLEASVEADGWTLRPGRVAEAIAVAAGRWGADIVVMGPARIGDLSSLLFESSSHDLMRETARPVVLAGERHA